MIIFVLLLLAVVAVSVLLHRGIDARPAGSVTAIDRDTERIKIELHAIAGVHEYH